MSEPLRVLSLFAGIGGFDLGLERTGGFKTVAFCEIEPFAQDILAQHWSGVPIYGDVRELSARRLEADGIVADIICGGFPCQDISSAGGRAGIEGGRSGLWAEYSRLIGELRPRFVIVENVSDLLSRGLGRVLGDLAALGYDAEWHCIPAAAVGAPHRRDRLWLIAYPRSEQYEGRCPPLSRALAAQLSGAASDTESIGLEEQRIPTEGRQVVAELAGSGGCGRNPGGSENWWSTEPDVGRVAYGISARVDRLKALGNAVVPQIPELIGRAILSAIATEAATAAETVKHGSVHEGAGAKHIAHNLPPYPSTD